MPRPHRRDGVDTWHHVVNRGVAKRTIFETAADCGYFLSLVAREVRTGRLELHSYGLMLTHYHLLVHSPTGQADLARRENMTLRQLYMKVGGVRAHLTLCGTPEYIADIMEEWVAGAAADGFNILPPTFPQGLAEFVDHVVPELQRRGLFRTEYQGTTLRDHLGLPVPVSKWATGQ